MSEMLLPFARRLPLSDESNRFVEWINSEGIKRQARGGIGPRSLLSFLVAWYKLNEHSATAYFNQQFPGSSAQALQFAIDFLEQNQASPSPVSGYPFITDEAQEALLEAQELVKTLRRSEIEPYHIYAALLVKAAKVQNPDAFIGSERGRVKELGDSFLSHVRESGYGEAWAYWKEALGPVGSPAPADSAEVRTSSESITGRARIVAPQGTGTRFSPRREATDDELCLNVRAYSTAIADVFAAAAEENDFVFALYGPWGRGKSTLIKKVASILEGGGKKAGRGYKSLTLSAWKYPTRPEVWVHLYQTILAAAQADGFWQRLRVGFRVGLLKHGWWPLWVGFGLLAATRLQLNVARWFFDGLGIIGILVVAVFAWKATKLGKRLSGSYFSTPNHSEKLGLQSVVGNDLADLLRVWITSRQKENEPSHPTDWRCDFSRCKARWSLFLVLLFIWAALGIVDWKIHRHARTSADSRKLGATVQTNGIPTAQSLLVQLDLQWSGTNFVAGGIKAIKEQKPPVIVRVKGRQVFVADLILGAMGIGALAFGVALAWKPRQYERLFLVVDDLDRCEQGQMFAVISNLRLFLDDSQISRRLQVAMLLDRRILRSAILKDVEDGVSAARYSKTRYFREQEEKLFVASLELPSLGPDDINSLAARFVDKEYFLQLKEKLRELETESKN